MKVLFDHKVSGRNFVRLLNAFEGKADVFSLTENRCSGYSDTKEHAEVLRGLMPYQTRVLNVFEWFMTQIPEEYQNDDPLKIHLYAFNKESKITLLKYYDSLFYDKEWNWFKPEDLCFFKEGNILMGSISHENYARLYDDSIKLPGKWEDFPEKAHRISIPISN